MPRVRYIHALLIYLLLAAGLLPYVLWYTNNPDTFQYLALSHRYADGSFLNIVNAYWSPLIIWLLVVPIKIIGNGIIAFKVIQLVIGAFTLYGWHWLLGTAKIKGHGLLLLSAIPFILAHGLLMLTADLLFLCIALFVLGSAINGTALSSPRRAALFGILGGLWYFSKAFALPLFLAFLVLLVLVYRWRNNSPLILRNAMITLGACLLLIAPWVLAMSMKYGYFTISEAARFNQTVEVAPRPGEIKKMPLLTDGPHHPPPGAISPWESPGDVVQLTPLRPWTDPARYAEVVQLNLLTIYYHDVRRQLGALFLILLSVALIVRKPHTVLSDQGVLLSLLMLVILNLGYAAILVHDRYIWLNTFIMLFLSAKLLGMLLPARLLIGQAVLVLFVLLAVKRPVKQILYTEDSDIRASELFTSVLFPFRTLENTYHPDHVRAEAIDALRPLGLRGPMASLHSDDLVRHAYSSSLHIAYELGLTYHGAILPGQSREQQLRDLREHGIRYFVVWEGMEWDDGRLILDAAPPAPRAYELPE